MFAFEQCLLCFTFHPDVWYDAASYLEITGRDLIERGVSFSPIHK
jgi:Pre-mRNA 3''-end processing (cleavage and polyadenylation) factor